MLDERLMACTVDGVSEAIMANKGKHKLTKDRIILVVALVNRAGLFLERYFMGCLTPLARGSHFNLGVPPSFASVRLSSLHDH